MQDIRTRSSLTSEVENPQRKFLRAASLELKKSLCRKVRDAAKKRAEEMEGKIGELDHEQAGLLAAAPPADEAGSQQAHGFTLKY